MLFYNMNTLYHNSKISISHYNPFTKVYFIFAEIRYNTLLNESVSKYKKYDTMYRHTPSYKDMDKYALKYFNEISIILYYIFHKIHIIIEIDVFEE